MAARQQSRHPPATPLSANDPSSFKFLALPIASHTTSERRLLERSEPNPMASKLFAHLQRPPAGGILGTTADQSLHLSVLLFAQQSADYIISGANTRTRKMLLAFRALIEDYVTPANSEISRELSHCLSRHISFLSRVRPLTAPMGNAIRQLKKEISALPAGIPEQEAKLLVLAKIDKYLEDRISLAMQILGDYGVQKICDNDIILTFGRSSTVRHILVSASKTKKFQVIVASSRPKIEGITMSAELVENGIACTLVDLSALSHVLPAVSKVILGAQCLSSTGALVSRVGTCQVATMARYHSIPVLVACESHKFSIGVHLDSVVFNELGRDIDFAPPVAINPSCPNAPIPHLLQVLLDVTPADFISAIISEFGIIPCSSVRVIIREYMPLIESTN